MEVQEMNAMVDDIERVLSKIAQELKQVNISILNSQLINYLVSFSTFTWLYYE